MCLHIIFCVGLLVWFPASVTSSEARSLAVMRVMSKLFHATSQFDHNIRDVKFEAFTGFFKSSVLQLSAAEDREFDEAVRKIMQKPDFNADDMYKEWTKRGWCLD
jgi:hypothetical protein